VVVFIVLFFSRETAIQYTDVKSRFDIKTDVIEDQFKSRTVGYKTRDEFIQTGKQLEQERQLSLLEKQKNEKKRELESAVKKKSEKQKLSFLNHDDDEEEDDDDDDDDADDGEKNSDNNDNDKATKNGDTQATKKPKMMKNPFIDTTFLPDREREQKEEELKKKLLAEWQAEQDKIKSITHRSVFECCSSSQATIL
jgi:protein FAM50